ncbi:DMT family transporter [Pseudalkalibacillus decolorationis]|uniref:DMT family transporter n=1 Tax=Pseudalkalibacillus decolorationis TaxID=163879 RepID=UPI0021497812|nr:DMT family transporter [Pseudalkalibacillus decolorationis]
MKSAYFKYIAALLLFGSNGIVASYILLNSYEIVFLRTLIGIIFLILVFALSKQKVQFWKNKSHFLYLVISGMAMGTSWMFLFEAYAQIGVSIASLAYYCGPVIVMVLSPVIFREKMTSAKLLGFLAVIIGMLCVNGQALSQDGTSWGLICGILSAITYAIMVVFNKKAKSITGLENAMCQLFTSLYNGCNFYRFKARIFSQHYARKSDTHTAIRRCMYWNRLLFLFFFHWWFARSDSVNPRIFGAAIGIDFFSCHFRRKVKSCANSRGFVDFRRCSIWRIVSVEEKRAKGRKRQSVMIE